MARLGCHEAGEDFSGAGEGAATVHGGVVVDEGEIAGLPREIEGAVVGEGAGGGDVGRIKRGAVTEGDGLGRIVAGVFPAVEGGDELVEEAVAAIAQIAHGGEHGRGGTKVAVGLPFPCVAQLGHARFGGFTGVGAEGALPTAAHAGVLVGLGGHDIGIF